MRLQGHLRMTLTVKAAATCRRLQSVIYSHHQSGYSFKSILILPNFFTTRNQSDTHRQKRHQKAPHLHHSKAGYKKHNFWGLRFTSPTGATFRNIAFKLNTTSRLQRLAQRAVCNALNLVWREHILQPRLGLRPGCKLSPLQQASCCSCLRQTLVDSNRFKARLILLDLNNASQNN